MRKARKFVYITAILMCFFAVISSICGSVGGLSVNAAATPYSDVLDDLWKDESFDTADYPVKPLNYGLEVIQIAESTEDELFVYVYIPAGETKSLGATSVKFSTTVGLNVHYELYGLTLCNSFGTLYKYVVNDFTVARDTVRYYEISSIQRKYYDSLDGKPDAENTVSEKAFAVGQKWTASTVKDGNVTYEMQPVEVIEVDKQTVGFRRYSNGINPFILKGSACDAHFLAFSTKRNIDRLLSADLIFNAQDFEQKNGSETLGTKTRHSVTLYSDEYASNAGGGWLGKKARWDRMASTEDFLNCGLEFKKEEKELFKKYDWVLNFYETEYDLKKNAGGLLVPVLFWAVTGDASYIYDISGVKVSDVTLMRLEFESEGKVLNLGVVSNVQTGSGKPTNAKDPFKFSDIPWWAWLIAAVVLLVVLGIVLNVLSLFFPIVKIVLKAVWAVISAPFRWIGNAVKRGRERRAATAATSSATTKKKHRRKRRKK